VNFLVDSSGKLFAKKEQPVSRRQISSTGPSQLFTIDRRSIDLVAAPCSIADKQCLLVSVLAWLLSNETGTTASIRFCCTERKLRTFL